MPVSRTVMSNRVSSLARAWMGREGVMALPHATGWRVGCGSRPTSNALSGSSARAPVDSPRSDVTVRRTWMRPCRLFVPAMPARAGHE